VTNALLGTAIAGLLVLGFALVGEALLGRASRDLFAWNESFLIGSGACAAALLPLSLVFPSSALRLELGILLLSALAVTGRRIRGGRPAEPSRWHGELAGIRQDRVALILFAAVAAMVAFFAALNLWHGHTWDSVQVWATKAKRIYFEGGLSRSWFPEDPYDVRLLSYPTYVSFLEALFSRVRGSFDFDRLKPLFFFFYVSLMLGTYAAVRTVASRRWALAMALLVALLPELTTGPSAGAYVDMPMAAFVAAVVAASLRADEYPEGWRSPLPWLIGAMTTLKQEGMILALAACGTVLLSWILERPRRLGARLRAEWSAGLVVLLFVVARVGYVRWIAVHDTTWGPFDAAHRIRALQSVGLVLSLCTRMLLDPRTWGLFWPAFFVAAALLTAAKQTRLTLLALAIAATIAVDSGIYLFTNWEIPVHIEGSFSRLLAQLAPAAAVVIGAAAQRVWSPSVERVT
jgi:hypothetical protein